jgi:signal transduction histidine kinase
MLIEDDGCGFDVEAAKGSRESGLGLFGMEERLALIGGTLKVDSAVGRGTRVSAEVPLPRGRQR